MVGSENMSRRNGVDGKGIVNRVGHLGSYKTAPHQAVKLILLRGQAAANGFRIQIHVTGPNGFMGVLDIFLLVGKEIVSFIFLSEIFNYIFTGSKPGLF